MSEYRRTSNEQPLKELVDKWIKAYGLEHHMTEMQMINAWPELMGEAVASRTEHIEIRNGKLILKLRSSVLRDELLQQKEFIINKMNEIGGGRVIHDIWFG